MEAGNPLLDDYVLGADRRRAAAGLLRADGLRRRRPLRRALLPRLLAARCEPSHVSLFRRDKGGGVDCDVAGAPARAGPHLRRRRQRRVAARRLARARARPRPAPAPGGAAIVLCGLSAGSLCWFQEAVTAFHGARDAVRGPRPAAVLQLRPLRRRAGARGRVPRGCVADGDDAGLRGRRRRGAALRRHASSAASSARGRARAPTASRRSTARREAPLAVAYLGAPSATWRSRDRREPCARAARSSRWAAAASRWSPTTPRSTSSSSGSRAGPMPRICFLPTASGDPIDADHALLRGVRATCRASRRPVAVPARHAGPSTLRDACSSRRTSSTSAAARCATCWRSGAPTSSTRSCARLGARDRARRPQRGRDVLVRGRRSRSRAARRARRGPRAAAGLADRPLRRRARAPARVPRGGRARASCPAAGPPTTASACCSTATRLERVVSSRPGGRLRARAARRRPGGRAAAPRRPAGRPRAAGGGRRRRPRVQRDARFRATRGGG